MADDIRICIRPPDADMHLPNHSLVKKKFPKAKASGYRMAEMMGRTHGWASASHLYSGVVCWVFARFY